MTRSKTFDAQQFKEKIFANADEVAHVHPWTNADTLDTAAQ